MVALLIPLMRQNALGDVAHTRVYASGHLGHPQVGERQLEFANVEHLGACLLCDRGSEGGGLVSVALYRPDAVVGRRRHGTTRRSVDQQAGTAEALEILKSGQVGQLVDIDALLDAIRVAPEPGHPDAGTLPGSVVTVKCGDLPLLYLCVATERLGGMVAQYLSD